MAPNPHQDLSAVSPYNQSVLLGAGIFLIFFPIIIVALRFYAARHARSHYAPDDWVILFALFLNTVAGIVLAIAATLGGMGEHQELGPQGQLIHYSTLYHYEKCRYANEIITTFNLGVVKTSVLLFYKRIFSVRQFKLAANCVLGLVAVWTITFTSGMIAQCSPPRLFWERFEIEYGAECIDVQKFYLSLAWADLVLDIIVLTLPIPLILKLNMPWKKKIAVLDVFLLGAIVLGSGIARLVAFLQVISQTSDDPLGFFYDTLWWTAGVLFWIYAENSVAIVGACLPTLAPLWKRHRASTKSSSTPSSHLNKISKDTSGEPGLIRTGTEGHSSQRTLFTRAAEIDIRADAIALEDRPADTGIHVEQTFHLKRDSDTLSI